MYDIVAILVGMEPPVISEEFNIYTGIEKNKCTEIYAQDPATRIELSFTYVQLHLAVLQGVG